MIATVTSAAADKVTSAAAVSTKLVALPEKVLRAMLNQLVWAAKSLVVLVTVTAGMGTVPRELCAKAPVASGCLKATAGMPEVDPPKPPADDPETKWPEDTPRILELQPFLLVPRHDGVKVLSVGAVAKELKLTEKQIDELFKVDLELLKKDGDRIDRMRDWTVAFNDALPRILKPEQIKRFRQLGVQLLGTPLGGPAPAGGAIGFPEIQTALKLTDAQKKKLDEVIKEVLKAYEAEPSKTREVREKYYKTSAEKALTLLTAEQAKEWKKLTGEPFVYTPDQYQLEKGEYKKVEDN